MTSTVAGSNGRRAPSRRVQRDRHERLDDRALAADVQPGPHCGGVLGCQQRGEHVLPCGLIQLGADRPAERCPPGRGQHLGAADPPECAVPCHLLQVLADRGCFFRQRRQVDAALLDRDQISGISTGQPAHDEFLDEPPTGSTCRATCAAPGSGPCSSGARADIIRHKERRARLPSGVKSLCTEGAGVEVTAADAEPHMAHGWHGESWPGPGIWTWCGDRRTWCGDRRT